MKRILLCLLFWVTAITAYTQNYNCFVPGTKQFFTNSYGYLRGIRIDSVKTSGADTIYYPFKTSRSLYPISGQPNGSWVGSMVTKQPDGIFLFGNMTDDTVIINATANVGDQWMFYNDTGAHYYIATVASADTMSILGSLDSVKTITIASYVSGTIDTTDSINTYYIVLSKNNGFVSVFDLYTFPYKLTTYGIDYLTTDISVGGIFYGPSGYPHNMLSSVFTRSDYHDPTQLEIYDFSVGDAFYRDFLSMMSGPRADTFRYDSIVGKTILSPTLTEYTIYRWEELVPPCPCDPVIDTYTYTLDVDTTILFSTHGMPEESTDAMNDTAYFYLSNDSSQCFPGKYYLWHNQIGFEGCELSQCFKDGFLEFSADESEPDASGSGICAWMITMFTNFSIKHSIYCGTYPDMPMPSAVPIVNKGVAINLSPNPANETITVRISQTGRYRMAAYNAIGQQVFSGSITSQQEINTGAWPNGLYNVVISDEGGNRYNSKVVVIH
jgi:Secretion system C-terminal sorting domain